MAGLTAQGTLSISIFEFLDYRTYLRAVYELKKQLNSYFSHRVFAQHLNLRASGHLLYVMQGKRALTPEIASRLSDFLKHKKTEAEYLLLLIDYTDAKNQGQRQFAFQRMAALRRRAVKNISPSQYAFYEKWYHSAIREAVAAMPFDGDCKALAGRLWPPVTAAEARESVALLKKLGLIHRASDGTYRQTEPIVSTGDLWSSAAIRGLQGQFIQMGKEALDRVPKDERDISNLTLSISGETLELIKQRICHLRAEILELARVDEKPDRVIECCFLVYPLLRGKTEGAR
jgi:uncharacterized protein (TIGR02147 family)